MPAILSGHHPENDRHIFGLHCNPAPPCFCQGDLPTYFGEGYIPSTTLASPRRTAGGCDPIPRRNRPTGGFLYLVLTSAAVSWAQAHFPNPQHLLIRSISGGGRNDQCLGFVRYGARLGFGYGRPAPRRRHDQHRSALPPGRARHVGAALGLLRRGRARRRSCVSACRR
jgi:hypothetical protein